MGLLQLVSRVARLAFLKAKFQKSGFFKNLVGIGKLICLFGFFLAFLHAKIICTKITYHFFSKSFSFKRCFLVSYIWQYFCRQESAEHGAQGDASWDRRSCLCRTYEVFGCDL